MAPKNNKVGTSMDLRFGSSKVKGISSSKQKFRRRKVSSLAESAAAEEHALLRGDFILSPLLLRFANSEVEAACREQIAGSSLLLWASPLGPLLGSISLFVAVFFGLFLGSYRVLASFAFLTLVLIATRILAVRRAREPTMSKTLQREITALHALAQIAVVACFCGSVDDTFAILRGWARLLSANESATAMSSTRQTLVAKDKYLHKAATARRCKHRWHRGR